MAVIAYPPSPAPLERDVRAAVAPIIFARFPNACVEVVKDMDFGSDHIILKIIVKGHS